MSPALRYGIRRRGSTSRLTEPEARKRERTRRSRRRGEQKSLRRAHSETSLRRAAKAEHKQLSDRVRPLSLANAGDLTLGPFPKGKGSSDRAKTRKVRATAEEQAARERLVGLRHSDPHSFLGIHPGEDGVTLRAYRPGVIAMRVIGVDGVSHPMELLDRAGLFGVCLRDRREVFAYKLRATYPNGRVIAFDDPYSFLPTIGAVDQHLWNEGRHERIHERLGAHARTIDAIPGASFSVWAPNAVGVSVV